MKIVNQNGKLSTDSRDVAEMINKPHNDLMKSIRSYVKHLTKGNFSLSEFFIESTYQDSTGRTLPHYYITKKGCDMVANKMTGEKGVLFTATYVTKFEEMENQLNKSQISNIEGLSPQLQFMIMMEQKQKELEHKTSMIEQKQSTLEHRIDNFDKIDINGDPQQRLNKMVRKYATSAGRTFQQAWRDFKGSFNVAYRTNITALHENYQLKHSKKLTLPQYLMETGQIEDAIRVADKMLNKGVSA